MIAGHLEGLRDWDDADLFAVRSDEADLGNADALIDAGFCADVCASIIASTTTFGRWPVWSFTLAKKASADAKASPTGSSPAE